MAEFFEEDEYYDAGETTDTDILTDINLPEEVHTPEITPQSEPAPQETPVTTETPTDTVTPPADPPANPQKPLSIADVISTINQRNDHNAAEVGIPEQPETPMGEKPTDKIIPPGADTAPQPTTSAPGTMDPATKDETEFFINAVNEMVNKGYSHLLHHLADTGKPEDYEANDKEKNEKIARYGAVLAAKYGMKLSIELLFGIAVVRNYSPPTMLALNHRRMKHKLDKKTSENEMLKQQNTELLKTMTEMLRGNLHQQPQQQTAATINPPQTPASVSPDNIPAELLDKNLMPPAAPQLVSNEWQRKPETPHPTPPPKAVKKDPSEGGLYYYDPVKRVWRNSITHKAKGGRHVGIKNKPKAAETVAANG